MNRRSLLIAVTLAWFVNVYSEGRWLHGGVYPTVERCRIAGNNLVATYRGLGYRNVVYFCVEQRGG